MHKSIPFKLHIFPFSVLVRHVTNQKDIKEKAILIKNMRKKIETSEYHIAWSEWIPPNTIQWYKDGLVELDGWLKEEQFKISKELEC